MHLFRAILIVGRCRPEAAILFCTLLLQRAPVLHKAAETVFCAPGRIIDAVRVATGMVAALGAHHALSGATGTITPASPDYTNPAEGRVDASFTWVARTDPGPCCMAQSWRMTGAPPGLGIAIAGTNLAAITGEPQLAGTFNISINAYQLPNFQGSQSPTYVLVLHVEPAQAPPPAPADFFGDLAQALGAGWYATGGWLNLYLEVFPWFYHEALGWLHAGLPGQDGAGWVWDHALGWFWTDPDLLAAGYLMLADGEIWLWFAADSGPHDRLFHILNGPQAGTWWAPP
jgi:hypothetical protein